MLPREGSSVAMVFENRLNCLFALVSHNYHILGHNLKYLFYEIGAVLRVCLPFPECLWARCDIWLVQIPRPRAGCIHKLSL